MEGRASRASGWHDPAEHVTANADQVARRMRYLERFLAEKNLDILEIGCSSGFMLYPLREAGHRVFGVEPSKVFGPFLRAQKIEFVDSLDEFFTDRGPKAQFDVVAHFFVLEHVRNPRSFLNRGLELVRPGGLLIMEIPNADDPLISVYDIPAFERFYWSVAHHWYFTEPALRYLLSELGFPFEILFDQRYDLSNHFVWALTGRPGGMGKYSTIFGEELDLRYKQLWVERRQCDTLVGVIRKESRR
jgi:SAM-dependent methyltransferase